MTTFFISDLHFSHAIIMKYDNRPFKTVEEMNKTIIENWNNTVKPEDTVYILGDTFNERSSFKEKSELLEKLNGRLHYIVGNHDSLKELQKFERFESIDMYKVLNMTVNRNNKIEPIKVVLSHYPFVSHEFAFTKDYSLMLYGHVHNSFEEDTVNCVKLLTANQSINPKKLPSLNVGCMMDYMNYTPKSLDELVNIALKQQRYYENAAQTITSPQNRIYALAHNFNTGRDI